MILQPASVSLDNFDEILWSTQASTAQIEIAQPGEYSVTVTDENNCTQTSSITVTNPMIFTSPAIINIPLHLANQFNLTSYLSVHLIPFHGCNQQV